MAWTGCGSAQPDAAAVRDAIANNLGGQGLSADTITCAQPLVWDHGTTRCDVVLGAVTLAMEVSTQGDDTTLTVRASEPVVVVDTLIDQVAATLRNAGHDVQTVHCEGKVWRVRKGDPGRCTMTDQAGQHWRYDATFSGQGSEHRATIAAVVPGEPAP